MGNTTTTSRRPKHLQAGNGILLKGTVLDMSSAQPGTAAVSDASMDTWMEYLHSSSHTHANDTGVQVTLSALDPNGNFITIGTATTDLTGQYSFVWTPTIAGKYTIVASFAGSQSYYPSTAETSDRRKRSSSRAPTPAPAAPVTNYTNTIIGIGLAIIIAMIVAIA